MTGIDKTGIKDLHRLTGHRNWSRSRCRSWRTPKVLIKAEKTVVTTIGTIKATIIVFWLRSILALHIPDALLTLCLIVLILLLFRIVSSSTDGCTDHSTTSQAHQ